MNLLNKDVLMEGFKLTTVTFIFACLFHDIFNKMLYKYFLNKSIIQSSVLKRSAKNVITIFMFLITYSTLTVQKIDFIKKADTITVSASILALYFIVFSVSNNHKEKRSNKLYWGKGINRNYYKLILLEKWEKEIFFKLILFYSSFYFIISKLFPTNLCVYGFYLWETSIIFFILTILLNFIWGLEEKNFLNKNHEEIFEEDFKRLIRNATFLKMISDFHSDLFLYKGKLTNYSQNLLRNISPEEDFEDLLINVYSKISLELCKKYSIPSQKANKKNLNVLRVKIRTLRLCFMNGQYIKHLYISLWNLLESKVRFSSSTDYYCQLELYEKSIRVLSEISSNNLLIDYTLSFEKDNYSADKKSILFPNLIFNSAITNIDYWLSINSILNQDNKYLNIKNSLFNNDFYFREKAIKYPLYVLEQDEIIMTSWENNIYNFVERELNQITLNSLNSRNTKISEEEYKYLIYTLIQIDEKYIIDMLKKSRLMDKVGDRESMIIKSVISESN